MHSGILFRHKENKSPAILVPQKELGATSLSGIRQLLETNTPHSLVETGKVDKAEEESGICWRLGRGQSSGHRESLGNNKNTVMKEDLVLVLCSTTGQPSLCHFI